MTQTPFILHDYQTEIYDQTREKLRTLRSLLVAAPTGSGKTVIIAEMMAEALRRGLTVALLVHREELLKQSVEKIFTQSGTEPGIVWKSQRQWNAPMLVLAQNSIVGRPIPAHIIGINLLFIDEAHHAVAAGWLQTIRTIAPKYLVGFTATPFRQDKEPLCPDPFEQAIRPITPQELIDQDRLCPAIIESPLIVDAHGDLQKIGQAKNLPSLYREAVKYAVGQGRTKIILYVSQTPEQTPVQVMRATIRELVEIGIAAGAISEDTNTRQRAAELEQFRETPGASVLINYGTLTEGTDLPLVDCIILGRNTSSESTIIQMIGRGLRKHPMKANCLVIDYSGRQDMSDIIHYWRLDEPKKEGAHRPSNPKKLTKPELENLTVEFPKKLSPMGSHQVEYPWFRPFPGRHLLALPLWTERGEPEKYITVEPTSQGKWRLTVVSLLSKGPSPLNRQQKGGLDEDSLIRAVRGMLGERAPMVQRNAPWRLAPASEGQVRAYLALKPRERGVQLPLAGDMSDAIAQERFIRRVQRKAV